MTRRFSRTAKSLRTAARDSSRVGGLTHTYYRYPARLSPSFARTAIQEFTNPGDWILDPFVGGGTTLVEARSLGRSAIGVDNNELAVFVSKVKTTPLSDRQLASALEIASGVVKVAKLSRLHQRPWSWIDNGYQRNLNSKTVWRLRKQIEIFVEELGKVQDARVQSFLRCALLGTAQWALDNRQSSPAVDEFRSRFSKTVVEMVGGMEDLIQSELSSVREYELRERIRTRLIAERIEASVDNPAFADIPAPKLVLTSPPYPGVHVLYHRWQIHGRKETPAPYWIANSQDGKGASHYTFGYRLEPGLNSYFSNLEGAFRSLVRIIDKNTVIVQVIAFSDASWQLPRYLETMKNVGLQEKKLSHKADLEDGRLWREVPSRKWYALRGEKLASGRELVLFHILKG
ncbi:MAG: TRM11 family methyltransferase [Anaerolineales bacterium]